MWLWVSILAFKVANFATQEWDNFCFSNSSRLCQFWQLESTPVLGNLKITSSICQLWQILYSPIVANLSPVVRPLKMTLPKVANPSFIHITRCGKTLLFIYCLLHLIVGFSFIIFPNLATLSICLMWQTINSCPDAKNDIVKSGKTRYGKTCLLFIHCTILKLLSGIEFVIHYQPCLLKWESYCTYMYWKFTVATQYSSYVV